VGAKRLVHYRYYPSGEYHGYSKFAYENGFVISCLKQAFDGAGGRVFGFGIAKKEQGDFTRLIQKTAPAGTGAVIESLLGNHHPASVHAVGDGFVGA
jgi:hypothetical protein